MLDTTYNEREAIRDWTIRAITLVLDSSEDRVTSRLRGVACDSARDDMGTGVGRTEYAAMLRGRGVSGYEQPDYARAIGAAVRDELTEILGEFGSELSDGYNNLLYRLLVDVLDLNDCRMADKLGEHYMPQNADDVEWNEDEDEDEDE